MDKKKICISLIGHVDAGKTTLSEELLFESGAIRKKGRVDTKDAFLDTEDAEKKRGITIYSKCARFSFGDKEIILLDTPGHVDFSLETERALSILDGCVLLISAQDMVTGHTRTLFSLLKKLNIPTVLFINKMDLAHEDTSVLLKVLTDKLSDRIVDFGKTDYLENVSLISEEVMEHFLSTGDVPKEDIRLAVKERRLFPAVFGSAITGEGVSKLLEIIDDYFVPASYPPEFGAYVYKISYDEDGSRLTYMKLLGGKLCVKDFFKEEKVQEIRLYSGNKFESVKEAFAGDVVAVLGLADTVPGMAVGACSIKSSNELVPVVSYAVFSEDADKGTLLSILKKEEEEEPGLSVEYNELTREISVRLMGEVQIAILTEKIKDRYNINVSFGQGRINYRETIENVVEGVGHFEPLRHYAEVHLRIEPAKRGEGISFYNEADSDFLSVNWQRLILTHLKEKEHRGVLTGSPVTDLKITLLGGKAHIKHTEGGDFRQATYRAVRQGLMQAKSVLLEPFYDFTLVIPNEMVGRALTDLDRMFCTATVSETNDGISVINGNGPVKTLNGYAGEIMAYTKGTGHISLYYSGYDVCHDSDEVIEKIGYKPENDLRNSPDSVFCSHGAGTVVQWNEVFDYMHLPLFDSPAEDKEITVLSEPFHGNEKEMELFVSSEEADEIIKKTAYSNQKGVSVAHKGISAALREKQRRVKDDAEVSSPVYRGTKTKESFLLIDGYNVLHANKELTALLDIDLYAATDKLTEMVSNYQGITGKNIILVFDAYKLKNHQREETKVNNITVVYTKTAETADRYIERYAHRNSSKYNITVATADYVEQVIIRGAGANLCSSLEFWREVEDANREFRNKYNL